MYKIHRTKPLECRSGFSTISRRKPAVPFTATFIDCIHLFVGSIPFAHLGLSLSLSPSLSVCLPLPLRFPLPLPPSLSLSPLCFLFWSAVYIYIYKYVILLYLTLILQCLFLPCHSSCGVSGSLFTSWQEIYIFSWRNEIQDNPSIPFFLVKANNYLIQLQCFDIYDWEIPLPWFKMIICSWSILHFSSNHSFTVLLILAIKYSKTTSQLQLSQFFPENLHVPRQFQGSAV